MKDMFKRFFLVGILSVLALPGFAESTVGVDLELYDLVSRSGEDWTFYGQGSAGVSYKSTGNANVKGELLLDFYATDYDAYGYLPSPVSIVSIRKAYIKARFADVTGTLGRTRITWGEGMVFNAGDVLYGSLSPYLDLTLDDKRRETAWLTALRYPVGRLGFIEGVVMPPPYEPFDTQAALTSFYNSGEVDGENEDPALIDKTSAGGRMYFRFNQLKTEVGYFYKGIATSAFDIPGHKPYISLHGVLGVDWYLCGSWIWDPDWSDSENAWDTLNISAGVFHMFKVAYVNNLTLRLEALVQPFQHWSPVDRVELANPHVNYALLLYPEAVFNIREDGSVSLSGIISPVDGSGQITLGGRWNPYQGLTLLLYVNTYFGEREDLFAWQRPAEEGVNGISIVAGARYSF